MVAGDDLSLTGFTNFLCPADYIFSCRIGFAMDGTGPSRGRRNDMDSLNVLWVLAAFLVPLGLAWLFIDRK